MTEAAHSTLGASSMYRWSQCPGSVREISKAPPTNASFAAEEGSDAHAYLAMCLTRKRKATKDDDVGEMFKFDGRVFTVTEDMRAAVQVAVDYISDQHDEGDQLLVETKFDLSKVHPGCFGTSDVVLWKPATKTLIVADYKHGTAVVKVENNPQLQYYALGALLQLKFPAKTVKIVVIQPRCKTAKPIREWSIEALDLVDFRGDLRRYAKATEQADAPLVTGNHCFFCAARPACPAWYEKSIAVAQQEFKPIAPQGGEIDLLDIPPFLRRTS